MDVPGYLVSAVFFKLYPQIVALHGWTTLLRMVGAMVAVSTICITTQQRLEALGNKRCDSRNASGQGTY